MKKDLLLLFVPLLLLSGSGSTLAQTTASFGPYTYTAGGSYQVNTTFTTQPWGDVTMRLTLTNTGPAAIDFRDGSEVWFTASAMPTIINYPALGGLSYPESGTVVAVSRGSTNLIQAHSTFPAESWATTGLAPGQAFAINFDLGSSVPAEACNAIAQSCRLYAGGWSRPVLYVPLTVGLSGTNNQAVRVNILDRTTGITTTQQLTSGALVSVFSGDSFSIWGSDRLVGNTRYQSVYTAQNPLQLTAGTVAAAITLPYTVSVIPSGTLIVAVTGLPVGAGAKLTLTATTFPLTTEVNLVNGTNILPALPFDTYSVSVSRYTNEAANTIAVPAYGTSYSFSGSAAALPVSFSVTTIKPFGVGGWPNYLAMGTVTLGDETTNDLPLSKAPLNAIFKYSGSGLGDTGQLLDDTAPGFPTTRTILQARRLEAKYAGLYPGIAPPTVMPVMVHYTAQASGGGIGESDVYDDTNLQIHYRNLIRETKKLLSYKDAAHPYPGTFVLSPDLLGAQQQANTPNSFSDSEISGHPIHVNRQLASAFQAEGLSTTGLPVFAENWPGYYQSINYLIKTIGQGFIKYGWQENVWATGSSLWVYDQANLAQQKAQAVSSFMTDRLGVFTGPWKPDFVVLDRYEADCFSVRGQNYAYNTRAWDRFVEFSAAIGKNLGLPVMLWQIPGGHLVTKNETVKNYDLAGHSSASATYFLGDANVGSGTANVRPDVLALPLRPANTVYNTTATTIGDWLNQTPNYDYSKAQLQKLADNNIFAMLWGGGETIGVAPIGSNGDDDGWLANKVLAYNQSGRVYQQQTTSTSPIPTLTILSPTDNASFPEGTAIPITVSVINTTATRVDFYNGNALIGTSTTAPFGYTLTNPAAGTYLISAKATTPAGLLTAAAVRLTVTAATCTAAPSVGMVAPVVSGSSSVSVSLSAVASVSCGAITKVEFYTGTTLLGSSTASPYSLVWANVAAGTYTLTAKAYANNTTTTSAPVGVTVNPNTADLCAGVAAWNATTIYATAGATVAYQGRLYTSMYWSQNNTPVTPYIAGAAWKDVGACAGSCTAAPAVAIAKPTVSGMAPVTIPLTAAASVSCGAIMKVEFYTGTTLLGSSTAPPYSFSWTNVAAGTYTLTAKAYANNTATSSAPVSLTVNPNTANLCAGVAAWNATGIYATAGMTVTYQGRLYTSMYWTQNNAPVTPYTAGAPWKDIGVCAAGSARLSVPEPVGDGGLMLWPNPAEDQVIVSDGGWSEGEWRAVAAHPVVELVDVRGRRQERLGVVNAVNRSVVVSVSSLSAGVYVLRLPAVGGRGVRLLKQ